jgi:hypothetical protein
MDLLAILCFKACTKVILHHMRPEPGQATQCLPSADAGNETGKWYPKKSLPPYKRTNHRHYTTFDKVKKCDKMKD